MAGVEAKRQRIRSSRSDVVEKCPEAGEEAHHEPLIVDQNLLGPLDSQAVLAVLVSQSPDLRESTHEPGKSMATVNFPSPFCTTSV